MERDRGFPHLAQRARQIWGTLDSWRFRIHTSSFAFLSVIPAGNLLLLFLNNGNGGESPEHIFASRHIHVIVKIEDSVAEVL